MEQAALDIVILVLRSVLGVVFIAHGAKHFINRSKTIAWTGSIGFRNPGIQWAFMTFAEMAIGIGLVAGLLTPFAAAGLVAMLVVAYWTVHRHAGFFITARPDEGYEYVLVLVAAVVAVATLGPGRWSLDYALGLDLALSGWAGLLIALAGIPAAVAQLAVFYRPSDIN